MQKTIAITDLTCYNISTRILFKGNFVFCLKRTVNYVKYNFDRSLRIDLAATHLNVEASFDKIRKHK